MKSAWRLWLASAVLVGVAYFAVPNSGESKLFLYNGIGFSAVVLILVAVRRGTAAPRGPWLWFAAGLTSFLTADIIYYFLELNLGDGVPFPSIADPFYLGMYPLMVVGLLKMVRVVAPGRGKASFIDAAVVATAMFGVLWVLFVDEVFARDDHSTAALVTVLAYPIMDVVLLAVAAHLVVTLHLRHKPFAFMVAAIGSLAVADTAYGIYTANDNFNTGLWFDAFWLGFYVLFAVAALHPDGSAEAPDDVEAEGRLTARQLSIMIFATLGLPLIDLIWGTQDDRVVTIITSALLFVLILARVFTLMQALQQGRDRLSHEARHDALTGLSNRTRFAERVELALERSSDGHVAVLFIDLDDFKTINDSLGHQAGDTYLEEVARRLEKCVRPGDTVARLGGDEFAVLLESAVDRNDAVSVARRVLDSLADPIHLEARAVRASASIGISMEQESGSMDVDALLRDADVAMYLSKTRGKGRFEFFERKMHIEAIERLDLKGDLQKALQDNQFVLHYQPIFDLESGQVTMFEALIRWRHPERGMISPDRFVPLAEENGMIVEIGDWVLHEACRQAVKWQKIPGYEDIGMSVNLSMRQLEDSGLINSLTYALSESGLKASSLLLEITESMLALDAERSIGVLEQMKTVGVRLAIDDFGTGYSSLSYLRNFPVDAIKIDRSFINELHRSPTSTALVDAVVNLAKALGATTVAEGIEYSDQAAQVRKLGCDRAQGYYYCRPLAGSAMTTMLKEHASDELEPLEAWRVSSERIQERLYDTEIHTGLGEIAAVASDIKALTDDLATPLMGRWEWVSNWADAFGDWDPIMIGVRSAETGQLAACALLATRARAGSTAVVAMGHGSSLHTSLLARDNDTADALADAIASWLQDMKGPWSLDLEQLHDLDPTAIKLASLLDEAQLMPELRVPRVAFPSDETVADNILSKSMRKQLRRANKKIEGAGLVMTIGFDRGRAITPELIDEVEAVHVSRDREARRNSDLDRPSEREFWRRIAEGGNHEWEVEIATLRFDGELAAYVVALLDNDVYRVYDGRMNGEYSHYSPGRVIEAAALSRALGDPRFKTLDWMSGVAAEKLLVANFAESRTRLVATSGSSFVAFPKRRDYRRHDDTPERVGAAEEAKALSRTVEPAQATGDDALVTT